MYAQGVEPLVSRVSTSQCWVLDSKEWHAVLLVLLAVCSGSMNTIWAYPVDKDCTDLSSMPQVALDRFDLFHAHLFLRHGASGGSLGLLFHAAEYPALCPAFPYDLGYCQANSTLEYAERAMDLRNLIYYEVRLDPVYILSRTRPRA